MVNRITSSWCQICPQWEPLRLLRALAPSDWAATHKQHIRLIWMIIPLGVGQHQYSNSGITQEERQHLGESDAAVLFVLMSVKLQVWAHFADVHVQHKCSCNWRLQGKNHDNNGNYVDTASPLRSVLWFSVEAEHATLLSPEVWQRVVPTARDSAGPRRSQRRRLMCLPGNLQPSTCSLSTAAGCLFS